MHMETSELLNSIMTFSYDICKQEFTEKRSLTCHVKEQHGHHCNQSFNRRGNYQRVCLFNATRKRSGGHLQEGSIVKKLKDNVSHVGGALDGTVNEYRLHLEDEQQDASNLLDVLKESTFQVENRIKEEVVKKRAVKFYLSLHVNFHLSTDVAFLTDQLVLIPLKCMTGVMYMMH